MSDRSDKMRLGKGLGALIPEAVENDSAVKEIPVSLIQANPFQPRTSFDPEKLQDLADSIKQHGVVQAVIVSPHDQEYLLVAGERRLRAAKMAGLSSIPAIIREYNRSEMLQIALIENIQREDLNPIEEAEAYHRLIDEFNYTQEELAQRIGKSRPAVANSLRLLGLPESIKNMLSIGEITAGQARPLLSLTNSALQMELARTICEKGLTARAVEKIVAQATDERKEQRRELMIMEPDPVKAEVLLALQRYLGTRVKISESKKGGFIEIHFYGEEDLERLLSLLLPKGID